MCVYIYMCVCVCIYVYLCVCLGYLSWYSAVCVSRAYIHTNKHIHTHVHRSVDKLLPALPAAFETPRSHIHTYIHTYKQMHTHAHRYVDSLLLAGTLGGCPFIHRGACLSRLHTHIQTYTHTCTQLCGQLATGRHVCRLPFIHRGLCLSYVRRFLFTWCTIRKFGLCYGMYYCVDLEIQVCVYVFMYTCMCACMHNMPVWLLLWHVLLRGS